MKINRKVKQQIRFYRHPVALMTVGSLLILLFGTTLLELPGILFTNTQSLSWTYVAVTIAIIFSSLLVRNTEDEEPSPKHGIIHRKNFRWWRVRLFIFNFCLLVGILIVISTFAYRVWEIFQ